MLGEETSNIRLAELTMEEKKMRRKEEQIK